MSTRDGGNGSHADYHIVGFGANHLHGDGQAATAVSTRSGSREPIVSACGESNPVVPGQIYCSAPGDPFVIGETGAVQLVR